MSTTICGLIKPVQIERLLDYLDGILNYSRNKAPLGVVEAKAPPLPAELINPVLGIPRPGVDTERLFPGDGPPLAAPKHLESLRRAGAQHVVDKAVDVGWSG